MAETSYPLSASGGLFTSFAKYVGAYAPNAAKQAISANTPATIVLNTELFDPDSIASLLSNQVTISTAGTYYIEAIVPFQNSSANYAEEMIYIWDSTNNVVVASIQAGDYISRIGIPYVVGDWYKISASATFEIIFESSLAGNIGGIYSGSGLTNSTANRAHRGKLFVGKK